jgi:hypothetical protein
MYIGTYIAFLLYVHLIVSYFFQRNLPGSSKDEDYSEFIEIQTGGSDVDQVPDNEYV